VIGETAGWPRSPLVVRALGAALLQKLLQVLYIEAAIAKNLEKQPRPDNLARVNGRHSRPPVFMTEKVMAALSSNDSKACFPERRHPVGAGYPRPSTHAAIVMR